MVVCTQERKGETGGKVGFTKQPRFAGGGDTQNGANLL